MKYIFVGAGSFKHLKDRGDEGEIVKAYTLEQVEALTNFFPQHVEYLERAQVIIKSL